MPGEGAETPRQAAARRSRDHRARRKTGGIVAPVPVGAPVLGALERLGLLARDEREPRAVGRAVARLLAAAPGLAAIGEALFPSGAPPGDPDRAA